MLLQRAHTSVRAAIAYIRGLEQLQAILLLIPGTLIEAFAAGRTELGLLRLGGTCFTDVVNTAGFPVGAVVENSTICTGLYEDQMSTYLLGNRGAVLTYGYTNRCKTLSLIKAFLNFLAGFQI